MPYKDKEKQRESVRKHRAKKLPASIERKRKKAREWSNAHPESRQKWKDANPEKVKEIARKSHLKKVGWTISEFNQAFANQNGQCWICSIQLSLEKGAGNTAHADHNHKSGKRRAILCAKCNLVEGLLDKSILSPEQFIIKLLEYYKVFDTENTDDVHRMARD